MNICRVWIYIVAIYGHGNTCIAHGLRINQLKTHAKEDTCADIFIKYNLPHTWYSIIIKKTKTSSISYMYNDIATSAVDGCCKIQ